MLRSSFCFVPGGTDLRIHRQLYPHRSFQLYHRRGHRIYNNLQRLSDSSIRQKSSVNSTRKLSRTLAEMWDTWPSAHLLCAPRRPFQDYLIVDLEQQLVIKLAQPWKREQSVNRIPTSQRQIACERTRVVLQCNHRQHDDVSRRALPDEPTTISTGYVWAGKSMP